MFSRFQRKCETFHLNKSNSMKKRAVRIAEPSVEYDRDFHGRKIKTMKRRSLNSSFIT